MVVAIAYEFILTALSVTLFGLSLVSIIDENASNSKAQTHKPDQPRTAARRHEAKTCTASQRTTAPTHETRKIIREKMGLLPAIPHHAPGTGSTSQFFTHPFAEAMLI